MSSNAGGGLSVKEMSLMGVLCRRCLAKIFDGENYASMLLVVGETDCCTLLSAMCEDKSMSIYTLCT